MRAALLAALLLIAASPALAASHFDLSCEGPFGADTTHERLVEAFGAENVRFTVIAGDEATYPEATVLFATDPTRRLAVYWRNTESRSEPGAIIIPEGTMWTVEGLGIGMTVAEVQALNGGPFAISGFSDMSRGMVESWNGGNLSLEVGACYLQLGFRYPRLGVPIDLDDPILGEGSHASDDPLFGTLGARVGSMSLTFD
jgi:hypothetical protein